MKSLKNHLSLIIALLTVLVSTQIYISIDRTIHSYEQRLKDDYSLIVVANLEMTQDAFKSIDSMIEKADIIPTDNVLSQFKNEMSEKNIQLLQQTLPKFYRIHLSHFPTPKEIKKVETKLQKNPSIQRVEGYLEVHDNIYKLMLLFKDAVAIFSVLVVILTSLLIIKEMRIWQLQHSERMSIMALFGAPVWLRSAVLFRIAIIDAIIATMLFSFALYAVQTYGWSITILKAMGINVQLYNMIEDPIRALAIALSIVIVLTFAVVLGNREE